MSDGFYKRLSNIFGLMAIAAVFALTVFLAGLEIKDLDLWLHMGVGRFIVQHGYVPSVDILSHTIAGHPWINHEWLFQVIVFTLYQNGGPEALIQMQVIVVTLSLAILLILGYNGEKQLATIFALLVTALVFSSRFTIRPDIFSLLCFATYILILSFFLNKRWSVIAIFLVQVFWTNIHGFFFFGPLFVLIGLAAEWLKRHVPLPYEWNRTACLTDEEYKRLKIIFGVVVAACLFNPMTIKGAWYPIGVFFQISGKSKIFFDKIVELERPITLSTLFSLHSQPFYKLMIIISSLSFFFNRRKIDIGVFLFWLVFLFFSLTAIRNIAYFGFAAYLAFVTNVITISLKDVLPLNFRDKKFLYLASTVMKVIIIVWILQYGSAISYNGYFDFDTYARKSEFGGVSQRQFPSKAVDFLVKNNVRGNFFNDFNSGAYLVGRVYPNIKVFIDGRTEVYGPEFFKNYLEIWDQDNSEKFAETLKKYKITGILLNAVYNAIPKKDLKYLYNDPEWIPVYFNYDGLIFLKDVPFNRAVIKKYRLNLAKWEPPKMDMYRLGPTRAIPYHFANRAYTLLDLGLYGPALKEVEEALKVAPEYGEAYKIKGQIAAEKKDYEAAFQNFRLAARFSPTDKHVRYNLAAAYYDLGRYNMAIEEYKKITGSYWPNDPAGYYLMTKTYFKMGENQKAFAALDQAMSHRKSVNDIVRLGGFLMEDKKYGFVHKIYDLVKDDPKKGGAYFLHMARLAQAERHPDQAREYIQKGLAAEPEQELLQKALKALKNNQPIQVKADDE